MYARFTVNKDFFLFTLFITCHFYHPIHLFDKIFWDKTKTTGKYQHLFLQKFTNKQRKILIKVHRNVAHESKFTGIRVQIFNFILY